MSRTSALFHRVDFIGALASGFSFIALNILLQVALVPLYLHSFGKTDFGILMIILSAMNFLSFGIFGLTGQVLRNLSRHAADEKFERFSVSYTRARSVFGLYSTIAAIGSTAVLLLVLGLGDESGRTLSDSLTLTGLLGAACFIVSVDFGVARIGLAALHYQTMANLLHTVSTAIFGALVIPWIIMGGGIAGVTGAMLIGALGARIATEYYIRRHNLPARWLSHRKFLPLAVREYGGKSSRLYMIYGAIFILAQSDAVILGILSGPDVVADFILIWKVAEVILLALSRVPEHLQPAFARLSDKHEIDADSIYRNSMFWLRITALCAGVAYAILGPWIVSLWVGEAKAPQGHLGYALAGGALFWLATARVPMALANVRGGKYQRALVRFAASEIVLKIALIFVLVSYVGEYAPLVAINALHLLGFHYAYARLLKPLPIATPVL